ANQSIDFFIRKVFDNRQKPLTRFFYIGVRYFFYVANSVQYLQERNILFCDGIFLLYKSNGISFSFKVRANLIFTYLYGSAYLCGYAQLAINTVSREITGYSSVFF